MLSDNNKFKLFNIAINKFPEEFCALILKDDSLIEIENSFKGDRTEHFEIDPETYIKYHEEIKLICHSHNNFDVTPSLTDMISQIKSSVPWLIVGTNGIDCKYSIFGDCIIHKKWIGIEFVHGASDCYSLVKNWYYHNKKVLLPEFPRENYWWKNKDYDLYNECFKKAGFFEIEDIKNINKGDVILFKIGNSKHINHSAVYCGDGLFAHHLLGKLSIFERIDRYINSNKIEKKAVRYDEKSDISRRNEDNFWRAVLL